MGRYRAGSALGVLVAVGWFVLGFGDNRADAHAVGAAIGADPFALGGVVYALGVLGAITLAGTLALGVWDRRATLPREPRALDGSVDAWGGKPASAPVRSSHGVGVGA